MAISITNPTKRLASDYKVLRIPMPRCLKFVLKRVGKSNGRAVTNMIISIFLKYDPTVRFTYSPRNYPPKIFVKYFQNLYPYPMRDRYKIESAMMTKYCCVACDQNFVENVKYLALMEGMPWQEFVVKVLSDKMMEELLHDPMLYRRYIHDY
jgi:hypothetical protein